jgi:hypothetical protein
MRPLPVGTYVINMHSMLSQLSQLQDSNSHKQVLPTVHALHMQMLKGARVTLK